MASSDIWCTNMCVCVCVCVCACACVRAHVCTAYILHHCLIVQLGMQLITLAPLHTCLRVGRLGGLNLGGVCRVGGEGVAVLTDVGAALRGGVMVVLARTSLTGPLVETCYTERRMYGDYGHRDPSSHTLA